MSTSFKSTDYVEVGLTKSQSMILTGQLLQPDDPLYNMVLAYEIQGDIDYDLFQNSFKALVSHCDALRTVINIDQELFTQRVYSSFNYDVELIDFSKNKNSDYSVIEWLKQRSKKTLDLDKCLFDTVLIKLKDSKTIWFFNQHHVITDAWSFGILFDRMQSYYRLAQEGRLSDATELPNFTDYVLEETSKPETPLFNSAKEYWDEKLKQPFTPTSYYRATPENRAGQTRRISCDLGQARCDKLADIIKKLPFQAFTQDLALMQVFATALFAYLRRISGNSELAIGTPSHSRISKSLKETVGLLIEIFPLQVSISETETFLSLYEKVTQSNQSLLMNALPGATGVEQNRAFDVLLNYIPSEFGEFSGIPVKSEWIHADYGDRNHLLRLQVHKFDQTEAPSLYFDVNEDVFPRREGDWVVEHFMSLFDALLDQPDQEIASILLVSDDMQPFAGKKVDIDTTIVELFRKQFVTSSNQIALSCEGFTVTYGDLDRRSDQLAAFILSKGVKENSVIAVSMDRSIDAVVSIIAVLKSACAFLPIDPKYPQERITFMLADANVAAVLTQRQYEPLFLNIIPETICVREDWPKIKAIELLKSSEKAVFEDLAYVIYTSGSTGKPKGVMVKHIGLSNYVQWAKSYYLEGKVFDFALFTSLSFDLTITSLFVPLISGGKIIVYPEPIDASDITIRKVIDDNQVDVIKLTPAHLSLIQAMDFSRSKLKKLIVGGEDFKAENAQAISKYFGGNIQIYNEYGPTEGTVACIVHEFNQRMDTRGSVPIGEPITNADIYILDPNLNPVPQGVVGEIFIGGVGVADGYLGRQDLTEERFLSHFNKVNRKLYRTGDRARYSDEGSIEFLGRYDHQVKVRGVRIEASEVEAALVDQDSITEALVDIAQHLPGSSEDRDIKYCSQCGLADNHPVAQLDHNQICRVCRSFENQEKYAEVYYHTLDDLKARIAEIKQKTTGLQDCIMLLSGGKDSSYALCRLVDMGLTPLVFTLDNGYISEEAKGNIKRLVDRLGLELIVGETPAMNQIFVESLTRFSNVCNGCFKTIYTLSMNIAKQRGISTICTGLSRGQIFETRLSHLFQQGIFDANSIDENVIEARKAYHRSDDVISHLLDVDVFKDDHIFHEVEYLDFYRYTRVTLDEMLKYLSTRAPWVRPKDTGRSTNCLINEAGIHVHKRERGYHNYALPYSWDVRLGHKQRDAALAELNDDIDPIKVAGLLSEIGYEVGPPSNDAGREDYLVGYYVAPEEIPSNQLKENLSQSLPSEYIPLHFVWLSEFPLTINGKVDRKALPSPRLSRRELAVEFVDPITDTEVTLVRLWAQMLGIGQVGVLDNFFDLGGDSIINIQIVSAAKDLGILISPQQIFEYPTIRSLAKFAGSAASIKTDQGEVTGDVPLLPSQIRYFAENAPDANGFSQSVHLEYSSYLDTAVLKETLQKLMNQHDALRSEFTPAESTWYQTILPYDAVTPFVDEYDISPLSETQRLKKMDSIAQESIAKLDIEKGQLIAAINFKTGKNSGYLVIIINHLVIDGVSWWVLLSDIESLYCQIESNDEIHLPDKTTSVKQWAEALKDYAISSHIEERGDYWLSSRAVKTFIPKIGLVGVGENNEITTSTSLDRIKTKQLLHDVPSAFGIQVSELLLTALVRAMSIWSGNSTLRFDIEGHGRDDPTESLDLVRTIGWFTSVYPLSLESAGLDCIGDDIKQIKEKMRSIPFRGVEYGVMRYLSDNSQLVSDLEKLEPATVLFNYMGQWERTLTADSMFRFLKPIAVHKNADSHGIYLLSINSLVFDDELRIDWTFDETIYSIADIESLSKQVIGSLEQLILHCLHSNESTLTPSDFPTADIDQDELNDLLSEFDK